MDNFFHGLMKPLSQQLEELEMAEKEKKGLCSECTDPIGDTEEIECGLCFECQEQRRLEELEEAKHPDDKSYKINLHKEGDNFEDN